LGGGVWRVKDFEKKKEEDKVGRIEGLGRE